MSAPCHTLKTYQGVSISDEGVLKALDAISINFVGAGVTATSVNRNVTVTIPTGGVGTVGPVGATGPIGPQGVAGPAGATGPASTVPGPIGATGATGPAGAQGVAGPAGATGATGPSGSGSTSLVDGSGTTINGTGAVGDPYQVNVVYAQPVDMLAGVSGDLTVSPSALYTRENMTTQANVNNDPTFIAPPAASESPWAQNQLGELLHYAPNVGWVIVGRRWKNEGTAPDDTSTDNTVGIVIYTVTLPRAGTLIASASGLASATGVLQAFFRVALDLDGVVKAQTQSNGYAGGQLMAANVAAPMTVTAGQVLTMRGYWHETLAGATTLVYSLAYTD
jgi:hypothetical protein